MSNAKVSILIPCFNAAPYVGSALHSALNQTYGNVEVIVVDDGSTDGSLDVIRSFVPLGVRWVRQANLGAAAARNRAFVASTGHFILYLDADDVIGVDHVLALVTRATEEPGCVSVAKWDRFYSEIGEATFPLRSGYHDCAAVEWLLAEWENAKPMTQPGRFLIPRLLLNEVGGWLEELSLIDDFEFFARVISRSKGVRFAENAKLYYRSGLQGSLSGQKSRSAVESAFRSLTIGTQHLLMMEESPRTRLACANLFQAFEHSYYPLHRGLLKEARHRVKLLGGSDLLPDGPPGFVELQNFIGWRFARRIQRLAEVSGLNRTARNRMALRL